jgi:hypothetical protein
MTQQTDNNSLSKKQNLHIVMWLFKDSCWVLSFRWLGVFMIIPTLTVAIYITYKTKESASDFFHNLAICSWIIANAVWMVGDFFFNDTLRPYATIFFFIGLILVSYFYLFLNKQKDGIE